MSNVNKLLLTIIVIGAIIFFRSNNTLFVPDIPIPTATAMERSGKAIRIHQLPTLFEQNKPLSGLASGSHYTVVEVYLDTCAICKRLEKGFQPFLDKRRDVIIHRVRASGNMSFSITGETQEEVEQQLAELQARQDSYQICGTPHIEVYAPDRSLIAGDTCRNKGGLAFLRHWISTETGISRTAL